MIYSYTWIYCHIVWYNTVQCNIIQSDIINTYKYNIMQRNVLYKLYTNYMYIYIYYMYVYHLKIMKQDLPNSPAHNLTDSESDISSSQAFFRSIILDQRIGFEPGRSEAETIGMFQWLDGAFRFQCSHIFPDWWEFWARYASCFSNFCFVRMWPAARDSQSYCTSLASAGTGTVEWNTFHQLEVSSKLPSLNRISQSTRAWSKQISRMNAMGDATNATSVWTLHLFEADGFISRVVGRTGVQLRWTKDGLPRL